MSKRLGERLVEAGKLDEAQLHRALTSQLVFGGHLGTSLLELGFIEEDTLGRTLSQIAGVPYADFKGLSEIPYTVIRSLPARLVEKHKVVPVRVEGRTLHLAMIDPKNLLALDEISFVTGYRIAPLVAPEVRILQALERYYNIPLPQRYNMLARDLARSSSRQPARPGQRPARESPAPKAAAAVAGRQVAAHTAAPSRPDPAIDHWEKYGYGKSWRDVAAHLDDFEDDQADRPPEMHDDTRPQRRAGHDETKPQRIIRPLSSVPEVSRELVIAESVDEIVHLCLSYVSTSLPRSLFFVVRGSLAEGWAGRGWPLSESAIRSLRVPIGGSADSLLCLIADGKPYHLGPVTGARRALGFYSRLGLAAPQTALIVPITVKDRVAAYLYADTGDAAIRAIDLPSMLSLARRVGFALQIIILRNKILKA